MEEMLATEGWRTKQREEEEEGRAVRRAEEEEMGEVRVDRRWLTEVWDVEWGWVFNARCAI